MQTCNNANRSFFFNRGVNGGGGAYANGENSWALSAMRSCEVKPWSTIEDVYAALVQLNDGFREQGDQK